MYNVFPFKNSKLPQPDFLNLQYENRTILLWDKQMLARQYYFWKISLDCFLSPYYFKLWMLLLEGMQMVFLFAFDTISLRTEESLQV